MSEIGIGSFRIERIERPLGPTPRLMDFDEWKLSGPVNESTQRLKAAIDEMHCLNFAFTEGDGRYVFPAYVRELTISPDGRNMTAIIRAAGAVERV